MRPPIFWAMLALLALLALACNLTPLLATQAANPDVDQLSTSVAATMAVMTIPPGTQPADALPSPYLPGPSTPQPEATLPQYPSLAPIPTLSDAAGKIVFTCQIFRHSLRNQICVMRPDGSLQERITTADNLNHLFPSLAPDGQSVVYVSNRTTNYQVYEADFEGNERQLTDLPGDTNGPSISPDGERVIFSYNLNYFQTLWVVNRDGSDARAFLQGFNGEAWDPEWSLDGSQVMFASDASGATQLYIASSDGSGARMVTNLSAVRGRSDWSPDGKLGATYVGDAWKREIMVFPLDGSGEARQITDGGNNLAPSFSPDGQWITFTSYRDRFNDNNGCEIYIMRIDGSQITRLTDNNYCDWQPRWGN